MAGLFFFRFDRDRLEIFGFEDLPAVEAFYIIDAIAAGDHHCSLVFAGGLHKFRSQDTNYSSDSSSGVKR